MRGGAESERVYQEARFVQFLIDRLNPCPPCMLGFILRQSTRSEMFHLFLSCAFVWEGCLLFPKTCQVPTCYLFIYFSQDAVFLEGVTVKGVTQITIQPKLGEVQTKSQELAEWEK